jgi:hypothetical protein
MDNKKKYKQDDEWGGDEDEDEMEPVEFVEVLFFFFFPFFFPLFFYPLR